MCVGGWQKHGLGFRVTGRGQRGYTWCVPWQRCRRMGRNPVLRSIAAIHPLLAFHQQWESCGSLLDASGWRAHGGWQQWHRGASPVPPGSPAWRELCSSRGSLRAHSPPKSGLRTTLRPPPPSPPCPAPVSRTVTAPGCCSGSVSPQAALAPADRHTDGLLVTCAPSRAWIPALHSPPRFSNANVAFDVHVFILQQKRDPALDRRSTVPTAALQQELPSCSLTRSQRFVIFEEITNLKVFGFGAAIAA